MQMNVRKVGSVTKCTHRFVIPVSHINLLSCIKGRKLCLWHDSHEKLNVKVLVFKQALLFQASLVWSTPRLL
jgi:hypothetical protein